MLITGRTYYFSPLGVLEIQTTPRGICSIQFSDMLKLAVNPYHINLETCIQQLNEYVNGERKQFDFPMDVEMESIDKVGICEDNKERSFLTSLRQKTKCLALRNVLQGNLLLLLPRKEEKKAEIQPPQAAKMIY